VPGRGQVELLYVKVEQLRYLYNFRLLLSFEIMLKMHAWMYLTDLIRFEKLSNF